MCVYFFVLLFVQKQHISLPTMKPANIWVGIWLTLSQEQGEYLPEVQNTLQSKASPVPPPLPQAGRAVAFLVLVTVDTYVVPLPLQLVGGSRKASEILSWGQHSGIMG